MGSNESIFPATMFLLLRLVRSFFDSACTAALLTTFPFPLSISYENLGLRGTSAS